MPRVKGGFKTRRRRKKILQRAKGYYGARSRVYKVATVAVDKALRHAYIDLTYSQFIKGLKDLDIALNRKAIADMAYNDPKAFAALAETVKAKLAS
jgi:large subunit ribosomal protein L20